MGKWMSFTKCCGRFRGFQVFFFSGPKIVFSPMLKVERNMQVETKIPTKNHVFSNVPGPSKCETFGASQNLPQGRNYIYLEDPVALENNLHD